MEGGSGGVGWRGSRGLMGRTTGGVQHPREDRRPDHTPRLVTPEGVGGLFFLASGPARNALERSWHASRPVLMPNRRFWIRFGSVLMILG